MGEPYHIEWKIDRVETYWYSSGSSLVTYVETTFWYDPISCVRKEITRSFEAVSCDVESIPDWARMIKTRNEDLESYE